jgi:predicted signal transduction protein with EAL and GGDEF domain
VRAGDTVARLGGDEFAILMDGAGDQPATAAAGRIAQALGAPITVQGREVYVFASIGIAIAKPGSRDTADDLLRNADVAMYSAKSRGKGRYAIFEPTMHTAALERLELEADLRWALEGHEFILQYQPVVQLTTGRISSVEALVRWRHPQRGLVPPAEFISMAEETGLIIPLGRWVLEESCRQVAAWQQLRPADEPLGLIVNISARQLWLGEDLIGDVRHALEQSGLAPGNLVLEITESVLMQGTPVTQEALDGLKHLGVQLAIDDFGTGYSSLSYLRGFPIDIVKIDRSFVDVIGKGFKETALIRGIIELSHALGLSTVAEGIETAAQLAELTGLGCQLGQGYYFGRPDDPQAVPHWLALGRLP